MAAVAITIFAHLANLTDGHQSDHWTDGSAVSLAVAMFVKNISRESQSMKDARRRFTDGTVHCLDGGTPHEESYYYDLKYFILLLYKLCCVLSLSTRQPPELVLPVADRMAQIELFCVDVD